MFKIKIEDIIGLTHKEIELLNKDNIISMNNVNCTIELNNIENPYNKSHGHALLYFDLVDHSTMTMVIIKIEKLSLLTKIKLRFLSNIRYKEYIGNITFTGKNEVVITYIRENIIKAL